MVYRFTTKLLLKGEELAERHYNMQLTMDHYLKCFISTDTCNDKRSTDSFPSFTRNLALWTDVNCSPFPGGVQPPSGQQWRECCSMLRQNPPPPSAAPCDLYQLPDPVRKYSDPPCAYQLYINKIIV